jgi:hypothetical protein
MANILSTIKTVGSVIAMVAVIVAVLTQVFALPSLTAASPTLAIVFPGGDDVADLGAPNPDNVTDVSPTQATQANLSESGYITSPIDDSTYDSDWAVGVTVTPADSLDSDETASIFAADNANVSILLEEGQYTARVVDGSQSAYVETAADLDNRSKLAVERDGDTVSLYENGSLADQNTTSAGSVSHSHPVSWAGSIDELRVWSAVGSGDGYAKRYSADPVAAIGFADRVGRAQFNGHDADRMFGQSSLTFESGVNIIDGGLEPPVAIAEGSDYELSASPVQIEVLDGGYLDDQPVLFVAGGGPLEIGGGPFASLLQSLVGIGGSALVLIVVGVLALAAQVVMDEFSSGGF